MAFALPALAEVVRIGQVSPPDLGGCSDCAQFQLKTGAGSPSYRVPKGRWALKAWSAQGGGSADGDARLLVFRRTQTPGQFKLIGLSDPETVPADDSPFFPAQIEVRRGDLLGIATVSNLSTGVASSNAGDVMKSLQCGVPGVGEKVGAGTSCPLSSLPSTANVEAKLRPR